MKHDREVEVRPASDDGSKGERAKRYLEDPVISSVVDDLRRFEAIVGEATSRDWEALRERARDLVRYFDRRAGEQRSAEIEAARRLGHGGET